jgi:tetratricopeptide (TPR) repeat protein
MAQDASVQKGRIGTATLPEVVRDLWTARSSGTLHIENGAHTKRIVFKRGDIVFAATNVETERLGERLVRSGKVKRSVLELAFRVMERSHERLGTTMVDWGWVSPVEMRRAVAEQIKDIIYSVFTWSAGEYRFEPADEPVPTDLALSLRTAEVIYEGARRMSDLRAIRAGIGPPSGVLVACDGARLAIPVTKEDGYILAALDGRRTILDVVSVSPLGEEETMRRMYALLLARVLKRKEPAPAAASGAAPATDAGRPPSEEEKAFRDNVTARHAAMKFGNLYDRLGVAFGASERKIQEAYDEAIASLEPDASFRDHLGDLNERLEKVRKKVVEAYETLIDPERRRHYDRSLSGSSPESTVATSSSSHTIAAPAKPKSQDPEKKRLVREAKQEAELYFLEANRFWQAGDYFDAVASMNEAVRLDPDRSMYHRVLGRWLVENPSCAEAAREHFERAIALDPEDREAHLGLAHLLESEGMEDQARVIYDKLAARAPDEAVTRLSS